MECRQTWDRLVNIVTSDKTAFLLDSSTPLTETWSCSGRHKWLVRLIALLSVWVLPGALVYVIRHSGQLPVLLQNPRHIPPCAHKTSPAGVINSENIFISNSSILLLNKTLFCFLISHYASWTKKIKETKKQCFSKMADLRKTIQMFFSTTHVQQIEKQQQLSISICPYEKC